MPEPSTGSGHMRAEPVEARGWLDGGGLVAGPGVGGHAGCDRGPSETLDDQVDAQ